LANVERRVPQIRNFPDTASARSESNARFSSMSIEAASGVFTFKRSYAKMRQWLQRFAPHPRNKTGKLLPNDRIHQAPAKAVTPIDQQEHRHA
jgi:hypothetical protein